MPRVARNLVDGCIYHVLNRGNGKQEVFHKEQDYRSFISLLKEAKERYPVKIMAYCLMPNHFHMVLQAVNAGDMSKWIQWLMTTHVRRYHLHYESSGHLWQGRYKSFVIQEDGHLMTVLRYVEGNPVRANLVSSAIKWQWSSHRDRLSGISCLIDDVPIDLPGKWGKYVTDPIADKELNNLRKSVIRQFPYGTADWQMRVAKETGIESSLRPQGRPKKKGDCPPFLSVIDF